MVLFWLCYSGAFAADHQFFYQAYKSFIYSFQSWDISQGSGFDCRGTFSPVKKHIRDSPEDGRGGEHTPHVKARKNVASVLTQIVLLDLIFSFDSILTAIGLSDKVLLMIIAIVIAIGVMMIFAGAVSKFINAHPALQILALSFLILIGFMLILDGVHYHVPKGYIYFAVFFRCL
ncbi:MAG: hypothetical protein MZV63_03415 [Marinilabiliales bacterium]|nr:hypothetical protein [Marinilabiliales bacterium]